MAEQLPYWTSPSLGLETFADNPEGRWPWVLVLDTSGSMAGAPISELNVGLVTLKDELVADRLAAERVELAIVTFGPVQVACDFQGVRAFQPPTLVASGETPMGGAVTEAMALLKQRRGIYRTNGIPSYKPWVVLITGGAPTDRWQDAAAASKAADGRSELAFFAVGVEGANFETLKYFSNREPLKLQGLRFRDLFQWLVKDVSLHE